MPAYRTCLRATVCASAVLAAGQAALGQPPAPVIPLVPGLTIVLAAHNTPPDGKESTIVRNIAVGDSELVVSVTGVSASGIDETTVVEGVDDNRKPLQLVIRRHVLAADLAGSRVQLLGFHTDDSVEVSGTTSLGPSLAIVRELRTTGRAEYSVIPFRRLPTSAGTLTRVGSASVPFPVLINGRRVELPAIHVTGQLTYSKTKVRPWEQFILDDPKHPLTLRLAYGADGTDVGSRPIFTRDVVRIDFPAEESAAIEASLNKTCRVEMPGIYFDTDLATLKPPSTRALTTIAELLRRQPQWRLSIEGHTDNTGEAAHNQDLSTRRAATVKTTLVRDFAIVPGRLSSTGFGAARPVDTNDTIAGRAHNRRVELVRECSGKS
jgi:outer membrane protein OmpA-like peptidoglycan-associated protein